MTGINPTSQENAKEELKRDLTSAFKDLPELLKVKQFAEEMLGVANAKRLAEKAEGEIRTRCSSRRSPKGSLSEGQGGSN